MQFASQSLRLAAGLSVHHFGVSPFGRKQINYQFVNNNLIMCQEENNNEDNKNGSPIANPKVGILVAK